MERGRRIWKKVKPRGRGGRRGRQNPSSHQTQKLQKLEIGVRPDTSKGHCVKCQCCPHFKPFKSVYNSKIIYLSSFLLLLFPSTKQHEGSTHSPFSPPLCTPPTSIYPTKLVFGEGFKDQQIGL